MSANRRLAVGAVVGCIAVVAAIFAGIVAPYDPRMVSITNIFSPPLFLQGGTSSHPLGADQFGRDVLSRLLYGTRTSLSVASGVLAAGGVVGIIVGIVFGVRRGLWNEVFNLNVRYPLSLAIQAAWLAGCVWFTMILVVVFGPGLPSLIIAMSLVTWPRYIKRIRARVSSLIASDKVRLPGSTSVSDWIICGSRLLSDVAPVLPSLLLAEMAFLIAVEFLVSYTELGIRPPHVSLGMMANHGGSPDVARVAPWWVAAIPATAAVVLVAGFYLLSSGLRERINPVPEKTA